MDAREFSITTSADPLELKLIYRPEKLYFRATYSSVGVDQHQQQIMRLATFSTPKPGILLDVKAEHHHNNIDKWDAVAAIFNQWLKLLKAEFKQPDLWAEMEHTPYMFADEEPTTDDRFTSAEIKQLEGRVAEVEQRILTLNLPPEVEAAVTIIIREVPAKAKRFTKKELADCIVGSLVKEGFKWGLTTEHIAAVWHGFQYFFTTYIGPHIP